MHARSRTLKVDCGASALTRLLTLGALVITLPATTEARADVLSGWFQQDLRNEVRYVLRELGPGIAEAVKVRVEDRKVYLGGELGTGWARAQAASAVAEISNVDSVVNDIDLVQAGSEPARAMEADELEARVERRLNLDPDQLGLVASQGVVRVDGIVASRDLPERITSLLQKEFGVARVSNAVTWVETIPAGYERTAVQVSSQ